ncbi:hypothetical protein predicted by Glimmer/Critica [Bdellovibrio bacteriovorus HD100]|uniref:Uncharacterized protein n=1 Tax=Bdellovibrio bacteriovorus (strain ATCC 15356 / DSM 50701 / NCIMB 9529 / HD100) TaxID=264462 RepID=Q6MN22_BDEBA|nr:hypothetical protein predicted by Glimmer/Critica [Bdellovibrio bacteriovorus HD100]
MQRLSSKTKKSQVDEPGFFYSSIFFSSSFSASPAISHQTSVCISTSIVLKFYVSV